MKRLLSLADWVLLRLRYPFTDQRFERMPTWMMRIRLIPLCPFLWLSRQIDDRLNEYDLLEMEESC